MTGSLRHLGGDRWKVTVYAGLDPTGRQRNRSRNFRATTERGAKKAANAVVAELNAELEAAAANQGTVAELGRAFLKFKESRCSPTTMGPYRQIVGQVVRRFGRLPVRDLSGRMIDAWYAELETKGMSAETIGHWHAVLRAMLRQAERWDMVDQVATRKASPPQARTRRVKAPTVGAVQVLLESASGDLRALLRLKAATGMRRGEICGLRWDDIAGDRVRIVRAVIEPRGGGLVVKVPKTEQSARVIRIDPGTVQVLAEHRAALEEQARQLGAELVADAYVFPNLARSPIGRRPRAPSWVSKEWARLRGGAPIRLHDLRHWHATQLLAAGRSPAAVAERLGHSKVTTTLDIYSHAVERDDEQSAELIGSLLTKEIGP
jgi:integrase